VWIVNRYADLRIDEPDLFSLLPTERQRRQEPKRLLCGHGFFWKQCPCCETCRIEDSLGSCADMNTNADNLVPCSLQVDGSGFTGNGLFNCNSENCSDFNSSFELPDFFGTGAVPCAWSGSHPWSCANRLWINFCVDSGTNVSMSSGRASGAPNIETTAWSDFDFMDMDITLDTDADGSSCAFNGTPQCEGGEFHVTAL
jgi:hypothetical protein